VLEAPEEPPVGTWWKDRWGTAMLHRQDGWTLAPHSYAALAEWAALWAARGPLERCGPYGLPFRVRIDI
jgi:hypothetical protein